MAPRPDRAGVPTHPTARTRGDAEGPRPLARVATGHPVSPNAPPVPGDAGPIERQRPRGRGGAARCALIVAITAAGLALRLADLGRESFWLDEAGRAAIAARPLHAIPAAVSVVELSPPLYHLLLHAWMRLVGDGDAALRLLSALLSAAAIPATYALAGDLAGRRTALVAALLASAAPLYVAYAQDTAMYALLALLALLSALGHARLFRHAAPPRGAVVLYAGPTLLALYTHYYAFLLLAAQNAYALWAFSRDTRHSPAVAHRSERDTLSQSHGEEVGASTAHAPPPSHGPSAFRLRDWLAIQAALAIGFMPCLPLLASQARLAASVADWTAPDPLAALGSLARAFTVGPVSDFPPSLIAVGCLPALVAGILVLRAHPGALALLTCYTLVPIALALLLAYPLNAFRERGFIAFAFVPHVVLAAGLAASRVRVDRRPVSYVSAALRAACEYWQSARLARALYGAALLALLLHGAAVQLEAPKEDWRGAAALIATLAREGDAVYVMHYGGQLALDRYLPPGLPRHGLPSDFTWRDGYTARYWLEPVDLDARLTPTLAAHTRAWLVLSHADGRGDALLLEYLDARYRPVLRHDFLGVRVRLWALRPDR